jgi:hypothetical protein
VHSFLNLAKRFKTPFIVCARGGCLAAEDIQIAIIRTHFEKRTVRTVPLIEYFFDEVVAIAKLKTDGPLVCLPSGIAFHPQFHPLAIIPHHDIRARSRIDVFPSRRLQRTPSFPTVLSRMNQARTSLSVREGRSVVRSGYQICALSRSWKETKSTLLLSGNTVTVTSLPSQCVGRYSVTKKEAPP